MAFNLLPQIDVLEDSGYSHEEWKMIHETKKIMLGDMNAKDIKVTATCVRVPVPIAHGESVYFTVEDESVTAKDIMDAVADFPGVVLEDDIKNPNYLSLLMLRAREKPSWWNCCHYEKGAFNMWIVADNLLKGAAWNTVENAEYLVKAEFNLTKKYML